jgi:hypothetical protein
MAIFGIKISHQHDWGSRLELQFVSWHTCCLDGVEKLFRVLMPLGFINNRVIAQVEFFLSWEVANHHVIDFVCSIICGADNGSAAQPLWILDIVLKVIVDAQTKLLQSFPLENELIRHSNGLFFALDIRKSSFSNGKEQIRKVLDLFTIGGSIFDPKIFSQF